MGSHHRNLCSEAHIPRCGGVSYTSAGQSCQLHQFLEEKDLQASPGEGVIDSAVALYPGATSDCRSLGLQAVAGGTAFATRCNRLVDGGDTQQRYAPTFSACLALCAGAPGCRAASFEASQLSGFANCYLKSTAGAPGVRVVVNFAVDTGVVVGAGESAATATAPVPPPVATTTTQDVTSTSSRLPPASAPDSTPNPNYPPSVPAATADPISVPAAAVTASPSGGGTVSIQVWVITLIFGSTALLAATAALLVLLKKRRRRPQAIESKNDAAYWPEPREAPSPKGLEQEKPNSRDRMGDITVVSTFGERFEADERDPDGRREWWKQGASPRVSVADSE